MRPQIRKTRYSGPLAEVAEALHEQFSANIPKWRTEVTHELTPLTQVFLQCAELSFSDKVTRLAECAYRCLKQKIQSAMDMQRAQIPR